MYQYYSAQEIKYVTNTGAEIILSLKRQHTLIKRYDAVFDLVNTCFLKYPTLKEKYDKLVMTTQEKDAGTILEILTKTLPDFISELNHIISVEKLITYEYEKPKGKTVVHINENEYKIIVLICIRAKFLNVLAIDLRCKNIMIPVRYIFDLMCKEITNSGISHKLELIVNGVIQNVTVRGNDGQSNLWNVIENAKGIDTVCVSSRELNNIYYKGLPTFELGRDPIKYFVSMTKTSVMYQMRDKIDVLNIVSILPIEEQAASSTNILKSFVYDEITNNVQLGLLLNEFKSGTFLSNKDIHVTVKNIAMPFLSIIFDSPTLNISKLKNIKLLNILTYKFMKHKSRCTKIIDLLMCNPKNCEIDDLLNYTDSETLAGLSEVDDYSKNFKKITHKVRETIIELGMINTIYTNNILLDTVTYSLKDIMKYKYITPQNKIYNISATSIIQEYIYYINGLVSGEFNNEILEAKNYIKSSVSEYRDLLDSKNFDVIDEEVDFE